MPHHLPPLSDIRPTLHLAASLLIAAIVIAALYLGQSVLVPLAVAFLIAFMLSPLVSRLVRRGLPRALAVVVVFTTMVICFSGLGLLVGSQLHSLANDLPSYQQTISDKLHTLRGNLQGPSLLDGLFQTAETVQDGAQKIVTDSTPDAAPPEVQKVELIPPPPDAFETVLAWIAPALEPLATAGIVLVFVALILLDRGDLRDRLILMLGGNLHRTTDALEEAGTRISKYLLMQLLVNVSYGIPMALGLWLIGVPGWILWGTLAALMRFIPYIGPLIASIFPLLLAFAVDPSWDMVLWTAALIILLELISNNIIEPLLYGNSTGLSAISLIAAATFWTALWGPIGLVLSTPLTVCLLVLGRNLPQLKFFDTLLSSTPVLDIPTRIFQRLIANDANEAVEIIEDTLEDDDLSAFYDNHGIAVLRKIAESYHRDARPEHRLRIAQGIDSILETLGEDYPLSPEAQATLAQTPARVALMGAKWEVDRFACQMLGQSLSFDGIANTQIRDAIFTSRNLASLPLDGIELLLLSSFSTDPSLRLKATVRRLKQRWPQLKVVAALWSAPPALLERQNLAQLGVDETVTSIAEARRRIERMLHPESVPELQTAPPPADDENRVSELVQSKVLHGHHRQALDALTKRAADIFDVQCAVISAIDEENEYIIGQSIELPGQRTTDGRDMITMPRAEAICDHVVSSGEILVVNDTLRDPHFCDHPAITLWNSRFYAGAPLMTASGAVLGAFCLLDQQPRTLSESEQELLQTLAADAVELVTSEPGPPSE